MASGLCPLSPMLDDHQAAFAKQCAEASSISDDWRKISACKNPEIGELRQKSVVQIPDHPSPHVLPQPSGLGKLVWSTWPAPQQGAKVFWVSGCVRPSVGSSSLLRQYRQATPRCYVPCAEPVTRQRGGNSEPPCQLEWHPLRARLRVSSSHPSPVVAHQLARPCGLATGGAGRRPCIASPPAALTVGDHSRSHW